MVLWINSNTAMAKHTKKVFSQAYIPKIWCERPDIWRIKKVLYPDNYRGKYTGGEVQNTDNAQIALINATYSTAQQIAAQAPGPGAYTAEVPAAAQVTVQAVQS